MHGGNAVRCAQPGRRQAVRPRFGHCSATPKCRSPELHRQFFNEIKKWLICGLALEWTPTLVLPSLGNVPGICAIKTVHVAGGTGA